MIARSLWLRPLRRRPLRFLATVAGVATGVASVVATLIASRAAVASLTDGVDAVAGRARLELTSPGGVDEAVLGELRDLAGRALLAPVIDRTVTTPASEGEAGELVRVLGLDLLLESQSELVALDTGAEEGPGLEPMLLGRGVALSRTLADELGLARGDPLELLVRTRPVALEVAGVFDPLRFASLWERVAIVDIGLAQELFETGGRIDRVSVLPRNSPPAGAADSEELERLQQALEHRLADGLLGLAGVRVAPPAERRRQAERMLRSLEFNLTALSGISVLVGAVLVATTLATSVVQRRREIALLRSLGASRVQIARTVLAEAGSIGLSGGLLGVAGGWLGARASIAGVRSTVASITSDALPGVAQLELGWILLGLALGLGTALAAALLPLGEATRVPPVQGLAGERPDSVAGRRTGPRLALALGILVLAALCLRLPAAFGLPLWALLAALFVMGALLVLAAPLVDLLASPRLLPGGPHATPAATPIRIAQAALEAGRGRAAWAAGAVGIAVALAVSMTTMIGSFKRSVVDWTETTMRSDLYLRPRPGANGVATGTLDPEVVRATRAALPEALLDPFHASDITHGGARVTLGGAAFAVTAQVGGVPFLDGRPSERVFVRALEAGQVVVNEPFARRFGVGIGDAIELQTGAGPVAREVAGVYRDYSNHMGLVVTDLADYLVLQPDEGPASVSIFLPEGAEPREARARLLGALGGRFELDALLNGELRGEVVRVFDQTFAVTVALQLVAAVVAVIAVLLVLYALVGERRRELAVVRVLGGSRRQVLGLVISQAGLLGAAGAGGGLAAGLAVGWVLVKVVNLQSFGWSLDFAPPWGPVAWTVLAVVPASLVAGLGPALATLRSAPEEVLRETG